ncbi:Glycosyl hydrolase family 47 [Venustampulla echinocandica]|uniref:alpha-1,2-Mannosidase n=1 Tax=Venustampulla echinocandica TaxID=2656787 RepID=A0A370U3Y2_9HELO|nr:Glycosyl hydrolase family 47 [Venustampulla echinocandica]RDL42453.1 Glycosyl hydrolase family 47 [Venustampulla echinocandica]
MTPARIAELRQETVSMFYHGFDNYMNVAFPEDELRPVSCVPLTRDQQNPRNVELNDVLGNYSLTLIDSLSTLAIIASAPPDREGTGTKALRDFQDGTAALVLQYGDGTSSTSGKGLRARGFDVDSKVQVFETVIRGVGGLLSAHLFAAGELPIDRYKPRSEWSSSIKKLPKGEIPAITWPNGFRYNGQLLRLALDLAQRLLPAFYTHTGMPYPRVNLRHGIPFYLNSPLNHDPDSEDSTEDGAPEITETCSAGAGSLVLEFTVLSRLTGDPRFEQLAKRAFWAVWDRRSSIGLLGAGVDAESGKWIGPYSGIGAGIDSFFEYALKTHILLSGHELPNITIPFEEPPDSWLDPNTIYNPLTAEENSPDAFLAAWNEAHAAIKRHVYSGIHHPHYVNVHLSTGSPQAYWIDSLGAYYPGLLTLAGEVEEAIETNLLYTALWTRYAALPERWSVRDGHVEGGLGWWPGRPEFIESNYHLYRATGDPWYLHVGEMVLKDIKRRCWTECGWAGLQDVRTGEKSDRMESFFLGETAKYLYLLFDPEHPLNSLDAAYVFTTEGHPLLIPREKLPAIIRRKAGGAKEVQPRHEIRARATCPAPQPPLPFSISTTAARPDIFHASSLVGLHHIPNTHVVEGAIYEKSQSNNEWISDSQILSNYTYYPWTLPDYLMPSNGTSNALPLGQTFTIEFPTNAPAATPSGHSNFMAFGPHGLVRLNEGILVKSLSGLRLGMVYESPSPFRALDGPLHETWRVWNIANIALGRDEQVFIPREIIGELNDPSFTRMRDPVMLDIVLQLEHDPQLNQNSSGNVEELYPDEDVLENSPGLAFDNSIANPGLASEYKTMLTSLLRHVKSALRDPAATLLPEPEIPQTYPSIKIPAIMPTGMGAAPIVDVADSPDPSEGPRTDHLSWKTIYFAGDACSKTPDEAPRKHEVIVILRGGCTFYDKLANIPSYSPSPVSLKLVIIIDHQSGEEDDGFPTGAGSGLFRPLLDRPQVTPSGLIRQNPISMVMVAGGKEVEELLRRSRSLLALATSSLSLVVATLLIQPKSPSTKTNNNIQRYQSYHNLSLPLTLEPILFAALVAIAIAMATNTLPLFLTRLLRPFSTSTSLHLAATDAAAVNVPEGAKKATIAAGCFWGVEHMFRKEFKSKGLYDARVGYIGGDTASPSYRSVCSGTTGHAEALQVFYDPSKVTYSQLLQFFYKMHDPTTANRQGPDAGSQYRSAIFYHDEEQEKVAREVTEKVNEKWWGGKVVTQILPAGQWWDAEDYHQKYLEPGNNPGGYECPSHFLRSFPPLE